MISPEIQRSSSATKSPLEVLISGLNAIIVEPPLSGGVLQETRTEHPSLLVEIRGTVAGTVA
jgi:hypothetical protein